ncbi:hypothetical protein C3F00_003000 [Pseudomonas sp. MWU13-2860]|nr:hypothetical protein C3F00_003000 [Pseudomonas sp. MWU13-2860]
MWSQVVATPALLQPEIQDNADVSVHQGNVFQHITLCTDGGRSADGEAAGRQFFFEGGRQHGERRPGHNRQVLDFRHQVVGFGWQLSSPEDHRHFRGPAITILFSVDTSFC